MWAFTDKSQLIYSYSLVFVLFRNMISIVSSKSELPGPKSPFQVFIDSVQSIYPDKSIKEVLEKYPVPQMVMIGSESTGKSATLENITKTDIFPTNNRTCTRCPIKVVMIPASSLEEAKITITFRGVEMIIEDRRSIKKQIEEIFNEIKGSTPQGFSNDEIAVTFVQPNVVRIDLIDLPGIVSYPPEARDFTTNLSLRYIREPNSLIICVAPATLPRLNSYEPIARILENSAQNRTIIALTMADKLRSEDFADQLTNRIQFLSEELQGSPFLACCSVINRADQRFSLCEQREVEAEWFTKNIFSNITSLNDRRLLQSHMGITPLLLVANQQYEQHLKEHWLPRTAAEIQVHIDKLTADVAAVGTIPTMENKAEFESVLCDHAQGVLSEIFNSTMGGRTGPNNRSSTMLFDRTVTMKEIRSLKYVKDSVNYMLVGIDAFNVQDCIQRQGQTHKLVSWKAGRFTRYWDDVKNILRAIVKDHIQWTLETLQPVYLNQLIMGGQTINSGYEVVGHFRQTFLDECKACAGRERSMVEDAEVVKERAALLKLLKKHQVVKEALLKKAAQICETMA